MQIVLRREISVAAALWLMTSVPAVATVRYVENFGVDGGTCGALASPCRSISQAIANASTGDVLLIGPGLYGDLDGDGVFTSPGEEAASIGTGCDCVVKIDKRLTVLSRRGQHATLIHWGLPAASSGASLVRIQASATVFRGFTLNGFVTDQPRPGGGRGLVIDDTTNAVKVSLVTAAGNGGDGFVVAGGNLHVLVGNTAYGHGGNGFEVQGGSKHALGANVASANLIGFAISGDRILLSGNTATANADTGFQISGGNQNKLVGNVASGNGVGVNFVVLGGGNGYRFELGTGSSLSASSAQGNLGPGIAIDNDAIVTKTNIFGNDTTGSNCGIENTSGGAVTATYDYWGTAGGPGVDPADGVCNANPGSTTTTSPFAATRYP